MKNLNTSNANYCAFHKPRHALYVFQNEFVIVKPTSNEKFLGTGELDGCIAIVVRNSKTGTVGICHVDARTDMLRKEA